MVIIAVIIVSILNGLVATYSLSREHNGLAVANLWLMALNITTAYTLLSKGQ